MRTQYGALLASYEMQQRDMGEVEAKNVDQERQIAELEMQLAWEQHAREQAEKREYGLLAEVAESKAQNPLSEDAGEDVAADLAANSSNGTS